MNFDLLIFLKAFLIIAFVGIVPIYLILRKYHYSQEISIVIAIGYSPVIIAFLNILYISVFKFNLYLNYLTIIIFYLWFFISSYNQHERKFKSIFLGFKNIIFPFCFSVTIGVLFWYLFKYENIKTGNIALDTLWNIAHVGELKNHFPPIDPHWFTGQVFNYHYLTNLYFAGISNFINISALESLYSFASLFTTISIFIIISLISIRSFILSILIFFILLLVNMAPGWTPFDSFYAHISYVSSTYFWSLPIFLSSIVIWIKFNEWRLIKFDKENLLFKDVFQIIIFWLVLTIVLVFSKGSHFAVIIFLEFFIFLKFSFTEKCWLIRNLKNKAIKLLTFLLSPLIFILIIKNMFKDAVGYLNFGIEIRDFAFFNSWNILIPLFVTFNFTIIYVFISIKKKHKIPYEFLFAGFFNFLLFFIFRHEGYSDLYFIFNAFLSNLFLLILIKTSDQNEIKKLFEILISILATLFIVGMLNLFTNIKGVQIVDLEKSKEKSTYFQAYNVMSYTDKTPHYFKYLPDLIKFRDKISKNALILVPQKVDYKDVEGIFWASFLERRIWNGSYRYAHSTKNNYAYERAFRRDYETLGNLLRKKPNLKDERNILQKSIKKFQKSKESLLYEDFNGRYSSYNEFLFNKKMDSENREKYINKFNWSHVIILNSDENKISEFFDKYVKIRGTLFTLIDLTKKR